MLKGQHHMTNTSPLQGRDRKISRQTIELRLNDIHDLFALPRHNAFQENYLPLSGVDQIALELKLARRHQESHVTIILPPSADQGRDLHAEVQVALRRYCDNRLDNLTIHLKARQINVVRSLQTGVIILGISLALAAGISNWRFLAPWLRMLLSNSISIFGSVALWSPTDAFLFGMRPLYNDIKIFKTIRDIDFDIQFEKPDLVAVTASTLT
jgi:hypothetical protein